MGGINGDRMERAFALLCLAATLSSAYSQRVCPYGKYGHACARRCPVGCLGQCHRHTGECTLGCRSGRYGAQCDRWCTVTCRRGGCQQTSGKCLAGCASSTWGPYCRQLCPTHCSFPRNCHQDTGLCTEGCMPSYWGESCTRDCATGCKDSLCLQYSGGCTKGCNNGLLNSFCKEPCPEGHWGENCMELCPVGCKDRSCHQILGTCSTECEAGMFGSKCDQQCPVHCKNNVCERDSGRCQDCQDARWGSICDKICSLACNGRSCNRLSGECLKCPGGCHGGICDAADTCLQGCKSGLWSSDCSKNCSRGCSGGECDSATGRCTEECEQGYWGMRCDDSCLDFCQQCERKTGVCESCLTGHYKLEEGSQDCRPCHVHCAESSCNMSDGRCLGGCLEGYWGDRCTEVCPPHCSICDDSSTCTTCSLGFYRNESDGCHPCPPDCLAGKCGERGVCSDGCRDGYRGYHCEEKCQSSCLRCDRYEDTCLICQDEFILGADGTCQSCPGKCKGDNCDSDDKSCVDGCQDGYWGRRCDRTCSDQCLRCEQDGSTCNDCEPGYQTDGWRCDRCSEGCAALCECSQCKPGYFGPGCSLPCSPSCLVLAEAHRPVCDKSTGSCIHGCSSTEAKGHELAGGDGVPVPALPPPPLLPPPQRHRRRRHQHHHLRGQRQPGSGDHDDK